MVSATEGVSSRRLCLDHLTEQDARQISPSHQYLRARRVIEIVFLVLGAPIICLLCLLTALAINLSSVGPVLFRQKRAGKGGHMFEMVKFRTMDASLPETSRLTTRDDDRVSAVAGFIRKHRLDELPQVWNVLKGEMSLIGPRPEPAALSRTLEMSVPHYKYRRVITPGITGLAQVHQGYTESIEEFRTKLEYDLWYIDNLSLPLDLWILLWTIRTVVTGLGAR